MSQPLKQVENEKKHLKQIIVGFNNPNIINIEFIGEYLPERQTDNWHYYKDQFNNIYHIKKNTMAYVIEGDNVYA